MDVQLLTCRRALNVVSKLSKGQRFLLLFPLIFYFLRSIVPATRQIFSFQWIFLRSYFSIKDDFISLVCWSSVFHTEIIMYTRDGKLGVALLPSISCDNIKMNILSGPVCNISFILLPSLKEAPPGITLLFRLPGLTPNADCNYNSKGNLQKIIGSRPSTELFF